MALEDPFFGISLVVWLSYLNMMECRLVAPIILVDQSILSTKPHVYVTQKTIVLSLSEPILELN